jgi:hypothetical protein
MVITGFEVACWKFSVLYFLQMKVSMTMREKLRQVNSAHIRLEALLEQISPHSLIAIFRRDHMAIKTGG